jgi:hypothetical protein
MPHTITDGQAFPMPCPECKQAAGMPFMAGTQLESGSIRVAMRCRECNHEWRFDMPVTAERKRESGTYPASKPSGT